MVENNHGHMLTSISNDFLTVTIDTLGAQIMSIVSNKDGTEYLWQGDERYWGERAPVLFPFVARLTDDSYKCGTETYKMGIHGFAKKMWFSPAFKDKSIIVLDLHSNEATKKVYPFDFTLEIRYSLRGNQLVVNYKVENEGGDIMSFGIGGHPGFNVPLFEGEKFEDYILEFKEPCQPDRVGFTPSLYLNGCDKPYTLREDRYIDLEHSLFDEDAVVLKNSSKEVKLANKNTGKGVEVSFPNMPYVGFWHRPKTDAPYVCIEPWSSLPARQDIVENINCKSDFVRLAPGKIYENTWTIKIL